MVAKEGRIRFGRRYIYFFILLWIYSQDDLKTGKALVNNELSIQSEVQELWSWLFWLKEMIIKCNLYDKNGKKIQFYLRIFKNVTKLKMVMIFLVNFEKNEQLLLAEGIRAIKIYIVLIYELSKEGYLNNKKMEKISNFLICLINLLIQCGDVEVNPGPFTNCLGCDKIIREKDQEAIECSMCKKWFHRKCSRLDNDSYIIMCRPDMVWVCYCCSPHLRLINEIHDINGKMELHFKDLKNVLDESRKDISSLADQINVAIDSVEKNTVEINEVKLRMDIYEKRLEKMDIVEEKLKKLDNIEERLDKMESLKLTDEIKKIDGKINNEVTEKLEYALNEKKREFNLIIFNCRESIVDDLTTKESEMIKEMCGIMNIDVWYKSAYRFGKKLEGKNRPICIIFSEIKDKWIFYKNRHKLKESTNSSFSKVNVVIDRTVEQREEYKLLREELMKRKSNGEKVVIYKGKIIEDSSIDKKDLKENLNTNRLTGKIKSKEDIKINSSNLSERES